MKRRKHKRKDKPAGGNPLLQVSALTLSQKYSFTEYAQGQHVALLGYPGTGKTFIASYLALSSIMSPISLEERLVIIKSAQPTKDIGFLPGTMEEKLEVYEAPYVMRDNHR
jgi:phosphate starvation-inducible PhoH-like protein